MAHSLYVHVPFCLRRCTYCDFNTYAGLLSLRPAYVAALLQEMRLRSAPAGEERASTLYFGGGTPALLAAGAIGAIVDVARACFGLRDDAEITLEANPGCVDAASLAAFRAAGINRLSLGAQSAHDDELALLGRIHRWDGVVAAVEAARGTGFDNLSLDLIYGLPGQELSSWEETLARSLDLAPEHLSLYALTLEQGTPLAERVARGALPEPDPDVAADMYEAASERLLAAGFWQYEISNWARGMRPAPGPWSLPPCGRAEGIGATVSHHNLTYWRGRPWLGFGAGAYSWSAGRRWSNLAHPEAYIRSLDSGRLDAVDVEEISPPVARGEAMMMGLRLAEGVTEADFWERFGVGLAESYGATLERLAALGLLTWDGARARLTPGGRLLGNQAFGAFLSEG